MYKITPVFFVLLSLVTTTLSRPSKSSSWNPLASLPIPRQEHTTVYLPPSTIAVLGGIIPTNDTSTLPIATTSLVEFYSIPNNTWSTSVPLPRAMNHINAAVVNRSIYILGGLADLGEMQPAWRAVPDSFIYSPGSGAWTSIPGLPVGEARGSAAVGVHDGKIVLAGGMSDLELSGNATQSTVSVVSIFDTERREWVKLPSKARYLPEGRDHAGAAVVGGKMFVLGGRTQGQENVKDTVFILDLCNLNAGWSVSKARMPTPRGGVAAGVVGGKVYVFGGEGNRGTESGVFDQVEVYDKVRDRWESKGSMRVPRHGTYAVGVGRRVYVPGGGTRQSGAPVADFDVFEA
ncbi:galactose oxidase [Macroventuria anomochaeta]|uniref:Galactose oxidase n=1 Tax=Macroventuria anomochaeta TaxID=301207 RepID=A0ACB6S5V1_9PLEO|nr:galactose oxidase [Macroventuria anomochaeta]KAF2629418.1 galactose oxidase [Macroventuria anomochaeta]